jgi:hypothetical protein
VGRISLQEGTLFIVDLVIWSVRSLPTTRRFITRVLYHPIYRFAVGFSGLEAKEEEAEILSLLQPERAHFAREDNTYNKGKSWVLEIFGIQLGEALGRSYLHLSIVLWRHYQPHTLFCYMYSRSALLLYEVSYILK